MNGPPNPPADRYSSTTLCGEASSEISEGNVFLCASVPANLRTNLLCQTRIPPSSQSNAPSHHRRRSIVSNAERAIGSGQQRNTQSRNRTDIEEICSAQEVDLFLQRHLPEKSIDRAFVRRTRLCPAPASKAPSLCYSRKVEPTLGMNWRSKVCSKSSPYAVNCLALLGGQQTNRSHQAGLE